MHKFLPAIFLICISFTSPAQHLPGIAMSNYAGPNALYHNPAFVTDNRYSVSINLVGAQMYTANNHVRYAAPYSFLSMITNTVSDKYKNERGVLQFPRSYLDEKLNGNKKFLNAGGDIRLPSVMFQLFGGKVGVGLSNRFRYILNTTQVTEPLARLISKTTRLEELQGPDFTNQSGRLHLNGYGEIAFTLGGVILDNETEFFKAGITAKRLIGLYNAHVLIDNSSYNILPDPSWDDKRQYINIHQINVRYGITKDEGFQDIRPTPAWLIGNAAPGNGWGMDIGAVYEYRPDINKFSFTEKGVRKNDASRNKYLYRISASLTDIGRIRFRNPNYVLQQEVHTENKRFVYDDFQKLQGSEGAFQAVNSSLGVTGSLAPNFRSVLPMAFQASIDYNVKPNVYVNGLWVQNLISQGAFGMKAESVIAVTPRYEYKWLEVSVPFTLMNRYRSPSFGIAGRAGPLWIGTDHMTGLFNIGNPKAFNIYFGLTAGLYRRPPDPQNQCWPPKNSWLRRIFSKR